MNEALHSEASIYYADSMSMLEESLWLLAVLGSVPSSGKGVQKQSVMSPLVVQKISALPTIAGYRCHVVGIVVLLQLIEVELLIT